MKKTLISVALVVAVICTAIGFAMPSMTKSDGTSLRIEADTEEYYVGDVVTYTVTLGPASHVVGLKFELEIPEGLTYVEGSGKAVEGLRDQMNAVKAEFTEKSKRFLFFGDTEYESKEDTPLMTLQCVVEEKAMGTAQTLSFVEKQLQCIDIDSEDIPCTVTDCTVQVSTQRPRQFSDVKNTDWFYRGVQYTTRKGLFDGISATEFGPKIEMNRAMVVQVLYSMAGKPQVEKTSQFPDVKDPDWFSDAVAWAVENGVSSGYADGRFAPEDQVTREQLAVMLHGYMKKPAATQKLDFADVDDISPWALNAMQWAVENKLMSGVGGNRVSPKTTATRAEGAVIMMQFDKLQAKDK